MRKFMFILILSMLVLSISLTGYTAEEKLVWDKEWPTKIRIGAASIGGGFYMGASSLANVLKEEFPELEVIVEQTKASVHNAKLIEANEVEFAMCTTDIAYEAWFGLGVFEGIEYRGLRIFMPTWMDGIEFVTLKRSGITDVTQFTGLFSGGQEGSQNNVATHKVFETFGIKAEIVNLPISDTTQALKSGAIEGYQFGSGAVGTSELAMTADIRVIGLTKEQGEYLVEKHPEFTYPITLLGGTYKGVDEDVITYGCYDIIIVRDDLPEDMVYIVLKAVYKHQDIVEATWPKFGNDMKDYGSVKLMDSPMHKGSIRYYKEIGAELSEGATSLNE